MDLFGRKARAKLVKAEAIADFHRAESKEAMDKVLRSLQDVASLNRVLREQDQLLFQMSQADSWERMRPYFQKALLGVNARMEIESQRIKSIMVPEIEATYGNDLTPRLEHKR